MTFKWIQPLCLKSVFTHHWAVVPRPLFLQRPCLCLRKPSIALLELSFKSVFIIRIVTMEEFFSSEHFNILENNIDLKNFRTFFNT